MSFAGGVPRSLTFLGGDFAGRSILGNRSQGVLRRLRTENGPQRPFLERLRGLSLFHKNLTKRHPAKLSWTGTAGGPAPNPARLRRATWQAQNRGSCAAQIENPQNLGCSLTATSQPSSPPDHHPHPRLPFPLPGPPLCQQSLAGTRRLSRDTLWPMLLVAPA